MLIVTFKGSKLPDWISFLARLLQQSFHDHIKLLPDPEVWSPDGPVLLEGVPPVLRTQLYKGGLDLLFVQWHIWSESNSQSSGPEEYKGH